MKQSGLIAFAVATFIVALVMTILYVTGGAIPVPSLTPTASPITTAPSYAPSSSPTKKPTTKSPTT